MKTAGAVLILLAAVWARPAAAQLRTGDSLEVIRTVQRYHAALAAGDTTALKGVLSYGATVLNDGFAGPLSGKSLESVIHFDQIVVRDSIRLAARVFGIGAYATAVARVSPRTDSGAVPKREAESFFLSRLGNGWFIEVVHMTIESP